MTSSFHIFPINHSQFVLNAVAMALNDKETGFVVLTGVNIEILVCTA
jgi:hypothetical protein